MSSNSRELSTMDHYRVGAMGTSDSGRPTILYTMAILAKSGPHAVRRAKKLAGDGMSFALMGKAY